MPASWEVLGRESYRSLEKVRRLKRMTDWSEGKRRKKGKQAAQAESWVVRATKAVSLGDRWQNWTATRRQDLADRQRSRRERC